MTEATRTARNAARLLLIDPTIRPQVAAVLATLAHYGHRPLIDKDVWRSPATQLSMYRRGVSKLRWGYHNATHSANPASLAADIIDCEKGWAASRAFWLCLGYGAKAQGLGWGGTFGLSLPQKRTLAAAFLLVPDGQPVPKALKFGWDQAHVQTARVTVAEAQRGKR